MKKKLFLLMVLGLVLVSIGNCFALTYDESTDGDLSNDNIGSLDVGSNSVMGTFGPNSSNTDFDTFYFTIDTGMRLNALNMAFDTTYFNTNNPSREFAEVRWYLSNSDNTDVQYGDPVNILGSSSVDAWAGFAGVGAGDYRMWQSFASDSGDSWTSDYTLTLSTTGSAPVPEPATMLLFGLGLLGVAGVSRRREQIN